MAEESNLFSTGQIKEKEILISDVPFFSQKITKGNYQENGFDSYGEAEYWENRSCGLICLKTVIQAFRPKIKVTTKELLDKGIKKHAYKESVGWIHNGLLEIAEEYGLKGGGKSIGTNIENIKKHITDGNLVIASVSHGFEAGKKYILNDGSSYIVPKGGHLVVIFGAYERGGIVNKFLLHHPSSYEFYEWPSYEIDCEEFLRNFSVAGNIIFFKK